MGAEGIGNVGMGLLVVSERMAAQAKRTAQETLGESGT